MNPSDGEFTGAPDLEPRAWLPSADALDTAAAIYWDDFPAIDLSAFSNRLGRELQRDPTATREHRIVFADALHDLSQLIDEVRFEAGLAVAYLAGLKAELDARKSTGLDGAPAEALALLVPFMAMPPPPAAVLTAPGEAIAGQRILGGWYAGQLLDSALIRSVAAVDRLATLLWCAAELRLEREKATGDLRLPAFRHGDMRRLATAFGDRKAWPNLYALLNDELMQLVKPYRDAFVHRRRTPSELHGHQSVVQDVMGEPRVIPGFDRSEHLALVIGFYARILRPAVAATCELLA